MTTGIDRDDGSVFHGTRMQDLLALTAFVAAACAQAGASEEEAFAVRLAVEEVFTNIIEYGYGGQSGPVTVAVVRAPQRLTIVFTDEAPAFDPAAAPLPQLDLSLDEREPGGLGWYLVRQMMDEVTRAPAPLRGNVFTLVKRLSGMPPDGPGSPC